MLAVQPPVVVEERLSGCCNFRTTRVHHRGFPEVSVECSSLAYGLTCLARKLARYAEGSMSPWQREAIDQAITEIAASQNEMMAMAETAEAARQGEPLASSSAKRPRKARKTPR
jgi:hypothetical protein